MRLLIFLGLNILEIGGIALGAYLIARNRVFGKMIVGCWGMLMLIGFIHLNWHIAGDITTRIADN